MMRSRTAAVLSAVAALALFAVWGTLWTANPSISGTSRGDFECLAPYDTVLTDADDLRGGEPPSDADQIAERCDDAGHDRFYLGLPFGVAGLLLGAVAVVVLWRRSGTRIV